MRLLNSIHPQYFALMNSEKLIWGNQPCLSASDGSRRLSFISAWSVIPLQDCHFLSVSGVEDTHGRCGSSHSAARCCAGRWTAALGFGPNWAGRSPWVGAWGWLWWCGPGASAWRRALRLGAPGSGSWLLPDGRQHQVSGESCPSGWLLQHSGSGSGWSDTQEQSIMGIIKGKIHLLLVLIVNVVN